MEKALVLLGIIVTTGATIVATMLVATMAYSQEGRGGVPFFPANTAETSPASPTASEAVFTPISATPVTPAAPPITASPTASPMCLETTVTIYNVDSQLEVTIVPPGRYYVGDGGIVISSSEYAGVVIEDWLVRDGYAIPCN